MKTLVLKNNFQMNMTMLPNSFVDHYMANANGQTVTAVFAAIDN